MTNARDKANIPVLNFQSKGIDDNATSTAITINSSENVGIGTSSPSARVNILESTVGTDPTADSSNFIKLTNNDIGTTNEVFGIGFSSLSGSTDYLGAFVQALGNYSLNFNHSLIFGTRGTSGDATERMRIDSSGNVGIGNTVMSSFSNLPATNLVVGSGSGNQGITIYSGNTSASNIGFADGASGDARNQGIIQYHHNGDYMRFFTSAAERMRIDSSGNVGIGTTSPDVKFHVVDTGSSQAAKIHSDTNNAGVLGMSVLAGLDTPSSSGDCKWVRLADGNDSGKAYIQFKSSSPNAEFAAISDERLKTNIQDTDVVGLDVINNLRLVKFDWNETATQDAGWSMHGHQKLGFVAQEVEAIAPEFISEDTNGFKIMGDSGFVPYLIKAMQEQQTKIEELEARITTLEANNP